MKPVIYTIVILVVILALAFMFVDMRGLYHCSVCGKTYWGKQESIHDKPACDICHEVWYVENCGIKETKWEKPYSVVSVRELGERLNWNKGKQKDFILTVRYKRYDTIFCPSFIVHPMGREEDFPKDMETVELNEPGLLSREEERNQ